MHTLKLFTLALGLEKPRIITKVHLNSASSQLDIYIDKEAVLPLFEAFSMLLIEKEMPISGVAGTLKVYACAGKGSECIKQSVEYLKEKPTDPTQIKKIGIDSSPAFIAGCIDYLPDVQIFDKFHVVKGSKQDDGMSCRL